jgi:hypothetical protein
MPASHFDVKPMTPQPKFIVRHSTNRKANITRRKTPNDMCSMKTSKSSSVINATFKQDLNISRYGRWTNKTGTLKIYLRKSDH